MSERQKHSNVLLVVSSYLPNRGGLQTVTSQLAAELLKRDLNVSVAAQRYPRTLAASEKIDGVPIQRLLFLTPRLRDVRRGRLDLFLASLWFFPVTLVRLIWRIAREKPDVVNLHFVGAPAPFLIIARWLIHFRFIVSLHGDDVEGLPRGTWFDRWIFRATLRRADGVTACSRYLLDQAREIIPEIEFKSKVIYNGVADLPKQPAADATPQLVAVGRLVPKKGFDILLRALVELECQARLIGDGPERNTLERTALDLNIHDRVEFCGAQSQAEVIQLMANAQIVVVPSRQEPFGLVALEAMALGKPIIAARVGGLPEILKGGDVWLVEPGNPPALAQAIRDAQAHLAQNPGFGERNRTLAARFSVSRMVDEYAQAFLGWEVER